MTTPIQPVPGDGGSGVSFSSRAELDAFVAGLLQQVRDEYDSVVHGLRSDVEALRKAQAGTVVSAVPHHGGGLGAEIAETWSFAEQTAAKIRDELRAVAA